MLDVRDQSGTSSGLRSVSATVNYLAKTNLRPEIWNEDFSKNRVPLLPTRVSIVDAGTFTNQPTLEQEGFALVKSGVDPSNICDTDAACEHYRCSLAELMQTETGADQVSMSPASVFRRKVPSHAGGVEDAAPAAFVHADYSAKGVDQSIGMVFEPPRRPPRRSAAYNMWRLLSKGPTDLPLAVCDARSVASQDLVLGDSRFLTMDFAFETVFVRPNAEHRWAYFAGMSSEDVLLFKQFDSDLTRGPLVPHTAFQDPSCPMGVEPRISIECRCMVYWY